MFIVAALYHFTRFKDHQKICGPLQDKCNLSGVTGSLLLAPEGINGTIAGSRRGIDNVIEYIKVYQVAEILSIKKVMLRYHHFQE